MFASIALARRIESAEARLTASVGQAVLASARRADALVAQVGGGVAVFAALNSPMNKLIGMGFEEIPEDALRAAEEQFRRRRAPLQAELSTLARPEWAPTLARRGYLLQGFENVLGRPIEPADREDPIRIEPLEDAARWLEVSLTGFLEADDQGVPAAALPERSELAGLIEDVTVAPGFLRYGAWLDGELAGVASLRLDEGVAQLCGATTLPRFRRRGVQSALLQRRLRDALRQGCDLALMTTQPGSKSQENGLRQGFSLLYSRALLVKDPD